MTNYERLMTLTVEGVADLVWIFKRIARLAGFEIINRMEFRNRRSGRTYR